MTSHRDILDAYAVVSVATACAIIGGDGAPVSTDTVYRLCRAGCLERRGKGKITTASIRDYLEHGRCPGDDGGRKAAGASIERRGAGGSRSGSARRAKTGDEDSSASTSMPGIRLLGRLPRGKPSRQR